MKRPALFLIFLLLSQHLLAQHAKTYSSNQFTCPNVMITLASQLDVDAFSTNYPSCTDLINGLVISGPDITNLSPLSVIISVSGGPFSIINNPLLTNLSGLENLGSTTGGNFTIENNPSLINILGLSGLTGAIGYSIIIKDNPLLTNLKGLENVTNPGDDDLHIENNDSLINLEGLSGMKHSDDLLISENDSFISFEGFENFEFTGEFNLLNNDVLVSLKTLNSIDPYCGFNISNNDLLEDIDGFLDIFSQNCGPNIIITSNPNLSLCSTDYVCSILSQETPYVPDVLIVENNNSGCNSEQNIIDNCSSLSVLTEESELFSVFPNPTDGVINFKNQSSNNYSIRVLDVLGRIIIEKALENKTKIDLSNMTKGIYFISVQDDLKHYSTKIIKQ